MPDAGKRSWLSGNRAKNIFDYKNSRFSTIFWAYWEVICKILILQGSSIGKKMVYWSNMKFSNRVGRVAFFLNSLRVFDLYVPYSHGEMLQSQIKQQ